jgi:hypothetical protein
VVIILMQLQQPVCPKVKLAIRAFVIDGLNLLISAALFFVLAKKFRRVTEKRTDVTLELSM